MHTNKKFIIPMLTGLGNAILMLPAIHALKNNYPKATIELWCHPDSGISDIFKYDPSVTTITAAPIPSNSTCWIHSILAGDKKALLKAKLKNPFMKVIYQSSVSKNIFIKQCLKLIGIQLEYPSFNQHETMHQLQLISSLLPSIPQHTIPKLCLNSNHISKPNDAIIIQLGAANMTQDTRLWSIEKWKVVLKTLIDYKQTIMLVGDKNEIDLGEKIKKEFQSPYIINNIGTTSVTELIHLISDSKMVIGVDSGIAHIAGALNKLTLVIWGPTSFVKSHQVGEHTHFIDLKKHCAPCRGPEAMGLLNGVDSVRLCKYKTMCMTEITPTMVIEKITSLLNLNHE